MFHDKLMMCQPCERLDYFNSVTTEVHLTLWPLGYFNPVNARFTFTRGLWIDLIQELWIDLALLVRGWLSMYSGLI